MFIDLYITDVPARANVTKGDVDMANAGGTLCCGLKADEGKQVTLRLRHAARKTLPDGT